MIIYFVSDSDINAFYTAIFDCLKSGGIITSRQDFQLTLGDTVINVENDCTKCEEVKTALFRNRDVQQRKNKDLRRQILVLAPVRALSPLLPGDSAHKYHAPWRAQSPKYRAGPGKQMLISGIFSVYRQPTEYQSVWPDGRSYHTLNTFECLPKKHRPSLQ